MWPRSAGRPTRANAAVSPSCPAGVLVEAEQPGAQTEKERLKLRDHGPDLVVLGGLGEERLRTLALAPAIRSGPGRERPPGLDTFVLGEGRSELELLRAFDHFLSSPLS